MAQCHYGKPIYRDTQRVPEECRVPAGGAFINIVSYLLASAFSIDVGFEDSLVLAETEVV